ncbi:MAG: WD40/YVTN/BNR-like repeat-containing protein, partial [Ferruginibacter sp.]
MNRIFFIILFFLAGSSSVFAQGTGEGSIVLRDIWIMDDSTSIVAGNSGVIQKTTDGGQTWTQLKAVTPNNLFSIFFVDKKVGIICGTNGTILKSTNCGNSWSVKKSGTTESLTEVFFLDDKNVFISNKAGAYLKSADAGETWVNVESPAVNSKEKLTKADFKGVNNSFIVAHNKLKSKASETANANEDLKAAISKSRQIRRNNDSIISSRINTLSGFWIKYNNLSAKKMVFDSLTVVPSLFTIGAKDTIGRVEYLNNVNEARIRQLKKQIGLAVAGNYQENFNPGIGEDDFLIYRRRVQVGLDWSILGDGYLSSRYKQQILKNESVINSLRPEVKLTATDYLNASHKIIYSFNQHKIKTLEQRQQIIGDKMNIANDLYAMKSLKKLDLMQIIQQQVEVTSMFQIYKTYNEQLTLELQNAAIPENILPLFDIRTEKLIAPTQEKENDSILELQIKNLDLENKFWKDVNLRT